MNAPWAFHNPTISSAYSAGRTASRAFVLHAVIKLIDTSKGNNEQTECCLEILDKIYQKRILSESAVSKLLEGVE